MKTVIINNYYSIQILSGAEYTANNSSYSCCSSAHTLLQSQSHSEKKVRSHGNSSRTGREDKQDNPAAGLLCYPK